MIIAVMLISLCLPAYAAQIDPDAPVTLTLNAKSGSEPVSGMKYSIYRVADADNFPTFTLTSDFAAYPVSLDMIETNDEWLAIAETLAGFVAADNLTPYDTDVTDANGVASYPNAAPQLEHGLYLVIGDTVTIGNKTFKAVPYFVLVPYVDETNDEVVYDVVSNVKISVEELPDTIDRRVIKIWNDAGAPGMRPSFVDVVLICDGEKYETVRLSAENNWRHDWKNLPAGHKWALIEYVPTGYTVVIRLEGITYVVTNSKAPYYPPIIPPPPPVVIITTAPETTVIETKVTEPETRKPETEPETEIETVPETVYVEPDVPETPVIEDPPLQLPQTGMLQWPVPLLGAVGLASTVFGVIKIKNRDDE